jgi:hypothetical protein
MSRRDHVPRVSPPSSTLADALLDDRGGLALRLCGLVGGLAALQLWLGWSVDRLAGPAVGLFGVEGYRWLARRHGLNPGWGKAVLALGLLVLGGYGTVSTAGEDATGLVISLALALVGAWLALDAAADLSTGRSPPPPADALVRDAGRVGRALDEEPRSRAELVAALDLPADRIEAALDELCDRGAVERRNGRYHATTTGLDPSPRRPLGRARDRLRRPVDALGSRRRD